MSAVPALTLAEITERGIDPALKLLPEKMDTPEARIQLLTTALQESGLRDRRQIVMVTDRFGDPVARPLGAAKSLWQAERGGGMVHGVRTHPATARYAAMLYRARKVAARDVSIWNAIERDDVLAAGLARLLIYSDPYKLPALGYTQAAWELYYRTWRPGRPRRDTWDAHYQRALDFVTGFEG